MGPMKRVWSLVTGVACVACVACVALACGETDYSLGLDNKKYGNPGSLKGELPPPPFDPGNPKAVPPTPATLCDGGGPMDGGACSVRFSTDILPKLVAECATCHTATGTTLPQIDKANSSKTWENFVKQKRIENKPYINPCSTDKAAASLVCNMAATGACGNRMPYQTTIGASPQLITAADTWLACGSPNN